MLIHWFSTFPNQSPYAYASNSPIAKLDPNGGWDIVVHVYNDRAKYGYGLLIVKDDNGVEVARYKIRAEGSNVAENQYNKRIRTRTNADTPLGTYDIGVWMAASAEVKID